MHNLVTPKIFHTLNQIFENPLSDGNMERFLLFKDTLQTLTLIKFLDDIEVIMLFMCAY